MAKSKQRFLMLPASTSGHHQLVALKARAKERAPRKDSPDFLPFVMKAVVAALQEHPYLNPPG
jgi:pyruvate/2-oxoglutarate dehydrogenase complex dihydrolipoamide acyltransferase (E2) component